MSQHDYNIANDSGLGVRTDLNALFMAIATQNSGDSKPNQTYPLQWWADTLTGYLKQRNAANDAWLIRWDLTKGQLATLYSPTFGGQVNLPTTTFINGNAVATLVAPNFSGNAVFEKLTAWSDVSLPASTTIGGISPAELSYLEGVTSSIQSQLNALSSGKQAMLVSGTNLKTVNGNSLLGSGNVVITQNPSAVFANSQIFNASGTFTVPAGVTKIMVLIAHGGGGGGGGRIGDGTTTHAYGTVGGGGGGSNFEAPIFLDVAANSTHSVVVASGGAGGSAASLTDGGSGGVSSFGTYTPTNFSLSNSGSVSAMNSGASGGGGSPYGFDGGGSGSGGMGVGSGQGYVAGPSATTGCIGGKGTANNGSNSSNTTASNMSAGSNGGAGGAGKVIVYW